MKNLLVLAAPFTAGVLGHPAVVWRVLAAFVLWCVVASGGYLLNDALDAAADRRHPLKRHRPVAAGQIPVRAAAALGAAAMTAGTVAAVVVRPGLAIVLAVYCALTISYCIWFKHEPVIDVAVVATGFVLRAVAGGVAAHVPLSNWFLVVASFSSLFMVVGKRSAERASLGADAASHRPILGEYSEEFLSHLQWVSLAVAITAYCLWAFGKAEMGRSGAVWFELSIAPFVLALLRYAYLLASGHGGAPEELALSDRQLQIMAVACALAVAIGVYAG